MGPSVTGGTPEAIDFSSMGLPAELNAALTSVSPAWTCAYHVDYVTTEDTHLINYELYLVTYDGTTPIADLKAAFDETLIPQGYQYSVGSFLATEEQMNYDTGELNPDVDPLTLEAFSLQWLIGVPNAVYPATTTTTVEVEYGSGGQFGLPDGPDYGDGDFRGTVTRVGYELRVPYSSYNP